MHCALVFYIVFYSQSSPTIISIVQNLGNWNSYNWKSAKVEANCSITDCFKQLNFGWQRVKVRHEIKTVNFALKFSGLQENKDAHIIKKNFLKLRIQSIILRNQFYCIFNNITSEHIAILLPSNVNPIFLTLNVGRESNAVKICHEHRFIIPL